MEKFFDVATLIVALKLFVSLFLGMIIGTERVWAHKTAGMRTYALVSMGSALFVVIADTISYHYLAFSSTNPLMLISQIVVGVGFIGAGLIFTKDAKAKGLTTATGLWVSAGIGMATGLGLYKIAVMATFFTLFIFIVLWFIEKAIKRSKYYIEDSVVDPLDQQ